MPIAIPPDAVPDGGPDAFRPHKFPVSGAILTLSHGTERIAIRTDETGVRLAGSYITLLAAEAHELAALIERLAVSLDALQEPD